METFNIGKVGGRIEPLYQAIYKLMYKGKLVGYRVRSFKLGLVARKYEYYDLDLELIKILNQDLHGYAVMIPPNLENEVNLIPKGNLLVPEKDIPPFREIEMCDYKVFMQTRDAYDTPLHPVMYDLEQSDYELKVLYNRYNDILFGGVLPYDVPVYYDTKLKITAGKCNYIRRGRKKQGAEYYHYYIRLSKSYAEKYEKEDNFRNVLIHEMIHVRHTDDGHTGRFVTEMDRINKEFGDKLNINVSKHSIGVGDYNYKYTCKDCGISFSQLRKSKNIHYYRCSKCKGDFFLEEDRKAGFIYDRDGNVVGTIEED